MSNIRWRTEFYDESSDHIQHRIDIIDTSYDGTTETFDASYAPVKVVWDGEGENFITSPMRASSISVPMEVSPTTTTLATWISAVAGYTTQRVFVKHYINIASVWTLQGIYAMIQDAIEYDDAPFYAYTITATDGLSLTRDQEFSYATEQTGYKSLLEVLCQALAYTGTQAQWGINDVYIQSSINWYDINQSATGGVLPNLRASLLTWLEDYENIVASKAWDVIEKILSSFGAQIKMIDGTWCIIHAENLTNTTNTFYKYSKAASFLSSASYTVNLSFPQAGVRMPIASMKWSYLPQLKAQRINHTVISYEKFSKGLEYPYDSASLEHTITGPGLWGPQQDNRMTHQMCLKFKLQMGFVYEKNNSLGIVVNPNGTARVRIQSGDWYYGDLYTKQNFPGIGDTWVANRGWFKNNTIYLTWPVNVSQAITQIELTTPPVPEFEVASYIITVLGVSYAAGPVPFECEGIAQMVVGYDANGRPIGESTKTYQCDNTNYGSLSKVDEFDTTLGDGAFTPVIGGLQVYNGSAWVASTMWAVGSTATTGFRLAHLYAREIMRFRNLPMHVLTGTAFMNYSYTPAKTFTWRDRVMMFNAGEHDLMRAEWTGEWVQISRSTTVFPVDQAQPTYGRNDQTANRLAGAIFDIGNLQESVSEMANKQSIIAEAVRQIVAVRGQNSDEFLVQNVDGFPTGAAEGDKAYLKGKVIDGKVKLIFDNVTD
ncbi:MAG: hypothetical protein WC760_02960 [Bacteroidia bacterium]|jgi:hypothetical protein